MFDVWLGSLAEALLHFLWQGALIAALAGIGLLLLKNARHRYGLLLGALLVCMLCVPVTAAWLTWRDLRLAAAATGDDEWLLAELATATAIEMANSPAEWTWRQFLVLGWSVGVGLCSLRLVLGGWGVVRLHRSLESAPDGWDGPMERVAGLFGWTRPPRVALSQRIGEPLALLWWRPVVVLPAAWSLSIPPAVLESILAHEFAHLYRWDLWINAGQRIVEACLFYHPAVWWLSSRLRRERELICDELAVSRLGQPLQYAQALEYVARSRLSRPGVLFAASMGDTHMDLLQRVKRVLGVPTAASPGRWWPAGVAALLVPAGIWMAGSDWTPMAIGDDDRDEARDDDRPENRELRELRRELERARDRIHQQEREIQELREGRDRRPAGPGGEPEGRAGRGPDDRPGRGPGPGPEGRPQLRGLPPEARERMQQHMAEMREMMQQHHREMMQRGEQFDLPPEVREKMERHHAEMRELMQEHRGGRGPEGGPHPPFGPRGPGRGPEGGPRPPFAGGPGREGFQPPREVLAEVMEVVRDLKHEVSQLRREVGELRGRPPGEHPHHPEMMRRPDGPSRDDQPPRMHREGPPERRGPSREGPPPAVRERRPDGEGPRRDGPPPEARDRGPEGRGPGREGDRPRPPEELRRPEGRPDGRGPDREGPPRDRPRRPEGEKPGREDGDRAAEAAAQREAPVAAAVDIDQPLEAAPAPEAAVAETVSDAPASAEAPAKADAR